MAGKATQQLTPGRGEPGLAPRLADPITGASHHRDALRQQLARWP